VRCVFTCVYHSRIVFTGYSLLSSNFSLQHLTSHYRIEFQFIASKSLYCIQLRFFYKFTARNKQICVMVRLNGARNIGQKRLCDASAWTQTVRDAVHFLIQLAYYSSTSFPYIFDANSVLFRPEYNTFCCNLNRMIGIR
jgi:hypothetical protein